jgi:hypothetical protein
MRRTRSTRRPRDECDAAERGVDEAQDAANASIGAVALCRSRRNTSSLGPLTRSASASAAVNERPVPSLDQQTQQGVQPADRAGPLHGDLVIALGQQTEHDTVGFGHGGYIGCVVDARETRPIPSPNATKHATSLHKIIYQGSLAP